MKSLKKWFYFTILIAAGLVYLTFVDHWRVYQDIFGDIKEYFVGLPEDIEIPELPDFPDIKENLNSFWESLPGFPGMHDSLSGSSVSGSQTNPPAQSIVSVSGSQTDPSSDGVTEVPRGESGSPAESGEVTVPEGPEFGTVDDTYFADAVFIGDSRTVGLCEYSGLKNQTTFYAATGLSVYSIFSSKCIEAEGQKTKITIEDALSGKQFKKVYICLGINELGTGNTRTFVAKYKSVLERIMELQPDAIIYVQSIPKVTEKRSNQGDSITNETIDARNKGLEEMAQEMGIYYLDVNPALCDEKGCLNSEYTHDGVHMKAQYVYLWVDFLRNNALLPGE